MTLLIRNGAVLSAEGLVAADVLVADGRVQRLETRIDSGADQVVDASGCLVGPGLVDIHAHLRDPGQTWKEDLETGSRAAAAGGFTAVVAMPNTEPPIDSPEAVGDLARRGRALGLVELAPAGSLTRRRAGEEVADVEGMYEAGVRMFTDDGDCLERRDVLEEVMSRLARLTGAVLAQHPEVASLTTGGHMHEGLVSGSLGVGGLPREAEESIVSRDLELVRGTGARYHCQHVSSVGTVDLIAAAKAEGLAVTAEVTPHHLSFEESDVEGLDPSLKMYPPVRATEDRLALVSALTDGTIDVVATDHAPHSAEEKGVGFTEAPRGVIGLETAASVVWDTIGDPIRFFQCLSISPARIAGLTTQGRPITPGSPANIIVFDPESRWVAERFHSRSANSPYLGREMKGRAIATVHRGAVVHHMERDPA